MSGYKRWISYIYAYEQGIKKNNIGYARIEMRNSDVKITVHINVLSVNEPMKVYLYVRENEIKGLCIGDISIINGVGEDSYTFKADSVAGSRYGIDNVCGLIIYCSIGKFYASAWDDSPIVITDSFAYEEKAQEEKEPDIEEDVLAADEPDESDEAYDSNLTDDGSTADDKDKPYEKEESPDADRDVDINNYDPEITIQSTLIKEPEDVRSRIIKAAEKMMQTYPRMYPFEDDEIEWCIRIEPQDIGQLPIDTWVIANNSFLLHGYYSYRHLMLMKTSCRQHPCYLIGVPGIYHNKDEFMAKMFGFELFKAMSRKEDVRGEFGYWCISILDKV